LETHPILLTQEDPKSKRIAFGVVFLYVLLIGMMVFLFKINKPHEVQEEETMGLTVDYGYTDAGMGEEEPSEKEKIQEMNIPSPGDPPFTQEVSEESITQDDEASTLAEKKEKAPKKKEVEIENVLKQKQPAKKISKNVDNTSNEAKETEQKPNKNALFGGFSGKGKGNGSQGNKPGEGNMGDLSGTKSDNYLGKQTGLGSDSKSGKIGSGLVGRKLSSIPEIVDQSNKTGKITIKVKVDDHGNVVSGTYVAKESTITDLDLIAKCEKASRKAKFSPSDDKELDLGTLVFVFSVR